MLRLVLVNIMFSYVSIHYICKMIRLSKNKKHSFEYKYNYVRQCVLNVTRKSRVTVEVSGLENLPEKNGYMLYANHQGKFDGLAIIGTHKKPFSLVIKKERSHFLLVKQMVDLLEAKVLDIHDLRGTVKLFNEIKDEVQDGKNYLVFPEGIYGDNKNNLQTFNTGCFNFVYKAKCPLVPVMLYDTYKVFNVNSFKKVTCKVKYLKPIEYEDYKDLNKREIAELVKSRIQREIDLIEESKN